MAQCPPNLEVVQFGMGCFWGAERLFWQQPGVYVTSVGYSGGGLGNPTYERICLGDSGFAEVVLVFYDPAKVRFESLLKLFWESHNPTQGFRQGNDVGSQYRSVIYYYHESDGAQAKKSRCSYQLALTAKGFGQITTEISLAPPYYLAEEYHQQYLAKNPAGYCGLQGTGLSLR